MASNPPFYVEDQTDEDFFDKLVNDDDDDYNVGTSVGSNLVDGSDSDETKAFANLSISDGGIGGGELGVSSKGEVGGGNAGSSSGFGSFGAGNVVSEVDDSRALGRNELANDGELEGVNAGSSLDSAHSSIRNVGTVAQDSGSLANDWEFEGVKEGSASAFANLSISDIGTVAQESGTLENDEGLDGVKACSAFSSVTDVRTGVEDWSVNEETRNDGELDAAKVGSSSLLSSSSSVLDGVADSSKEMVMSEIHETKSNGGTGVKEVQWAAFTSDPVGNVGHGFGSHSDFFTEFGDNVVDPTVQEENSINESNVAVPGSMAVSSAYDYSHQTEDVGHNNGAATNEVTNGQDPNAQYWENMYPGWKYDASTGLWYQVDGGYDAASNRQELHAADGAISDDKSEISYFQQTAQSIVGAVAEKGTTESVDTWNPDSQVSYTNGSLSNRNQASQENNGYPSHMYFDTQYPGWYYDMIAQEWRTLDSYISQPQVQAQDHLNHSGFPLNGTNADHEQKSYVQHGQVDNYGSKGFSSQDPYWNGSSGFVKQQGLNTWQPDTVSHNVATSDFRGIQQGQNNYNVSFPVNNHANPWQPDTISHNVATSDFAVIPQGQNNYNMSFPVDNHVGQQSSYNYPGIHASLEKTCSVRNDFSAAPGFQGSFSGGNFSQSFNQSTVVQKEPMNVSNAYYSNQNQLSYSQQPAQTMQQFSYAPIAGRSSAGRPPHALVTFGFGGKLIVMKDATLANSSYSSQESKRGSLSVLNLTDVIGGNDASNNRSSACAYVHTLCQQSFPGPLTGGNGSSKELNKWIDERITQCESSNLDYRKGEVLRLLLSLLKIACQYYGKLRSPFGTDTASKETDAPEIAVARLFASAKGSGAQFTDYGSLSVCLQQLPSEGKLQATAAEVQTLLVSGRKKEALHCAQEGHLWGPALVLAAQIGDQFYVDTVRQMALRQLVAGSPLRTLCLLIAGQPADVFSTESTACGGNPGFVAMTQQPTQIPLGANCMLNDWEENLALITANRTKDDELVLIHLGDCLWKEKSDIIAAHICYLVAEANFEPYSDSARMSLVGADHWRYPRTYASPEAIQRTEVYEYSKLLGNSQFTLLPFQPYKLIYAHMLAEVGRVSDSLKYCQVLSKSLKTCRAPEVEIWRQLVSLLEERIKTHQQGGFSTNLAPGKLVGKLFNLFDSTAHRVVGGLPPPVPVSNVKNNHHHHQSVESRLYDSQSTIATTSIAASASMEPISEYNVDSNKRSVHNRSISEPDFSRSPSQGHSDSSNKGTSDDSQNKASGVTSRFGRFSFGSQLFQKTVGLVLKPRQGKQAKLGDTNKFYYDEKLKRWVEEGAEPPAEEAALPPPPTAATFLNGTSDSRLKSASKNERSPGDGSPEFSSPTSLGHSLGMPPIPNASNQFSARARTGVRARYVDTFNQGGGNPTNLVQSPSIPTLKSLSGPNPKFFVPAPVPSSEQPDDASPDSMQSMIEHSSISSPNDSFQSSQNPSPSSIQRFGSMDNITNSASVKRINVPTQPHPRRAASWSGSFADGSSPPPNDSRVKPLGEVLGMPPTSLPSESALAHSSMNGGSFGDDLHEVDL